MSKENKNDKIEEVVIAIKSHCARYGEPSTKFLRNIIRSAIQEALEDVIKEVENKEFNLGEREWCIKCMKRITKYQKQKAKDWGLTK